MSDRDIKYHKIDGIRDKIFERALNCEIKNENIKLFTDQIDHKNSILLFALPGIIFLYLCTVTKIKKYQELLETIEEALYKESDGLAICSHIKILFCSDDSTISYIKNITYGPELFSDERIDSISIDAHWSPHGFEIFQLLLAQSSLLGSGIFSKSICFTLAISKILSYLIYKKILKKNDEFYWLSQEDIESFSKLELISFGGLSIYQIFITNLEFEVEKLTKFFLNINKVYSYKGSLVLDFPSHPSLYFHEYATETWIFYSISDSKIPQKKFNPKSKKHIGFAMDINIVKKALVEKFKNRSIKEFNYKLIMIAKISKDYPGYDWLKGAYVYYPQKDNSLNNLTNELYQMTKASIGTTYVIKNMLHDFVDNPNEDGKLNIDNISAFISFCEEHEELSEEVLQYKEFYRLLTGVDSYFSPSDVKNSDYIKSRRKLLTGFRNYISPELKQILIEANDDFDDICSDIHYQLKKAIKKREISKEKKDDEMLNFAQEIWDKNDFKHILKNDLEDIDCEPMNNRKRGSRGRFLVKVAKRNNKELSEKVIFRKLNISR